MPIEMCKVGVAHGVELARDEDVLAAGPIARVRDLNSERTVV